MTDSKEDLLLQITILRKIVSNQSLCSRDKNKLRMRIDALVDTMENIKWGNKE